ncbi:MAG TPA: alpha/beta hydrolase [Hyphomicrobiales bacterium]|nr:alpha/beta hydrolase [Hyphomicrobiales bacterium]
MADAPPQFLTVGAGDDARPIAVGVLAGAAPAVVWLGGFRSDMTGTKASRLAHWCADESRAMIRFDYSGHGASGGRFVDGTISRWLEESLSVIGTYGGSAPVLAGSSMGAWLALLAARAMTEGGNPPSGLVLIAPAVDFTELLMWPALPKRARRQIENTGEWLRADAYSSESYPLTRALFEDGRRHLLLGAPFQVGAPVRILQGMADAEVPWRHAQALVEHLAEDDVTLTLVKDGDHRLSRPQDLDLIVSAVADIHRA